MLATHLQSVGFGAYGSGGVTLCQAESSLPAGARVLVRPVAGLPSPCEVVTIMADDQHPTIEDCSDSEDEQAYDSNNNNTEANNNNNNNNNSSACEDRNQTSKPYHKLLDRPLNIQVTAKVLFGSVGAISALNAERKKPKPSSS